mgnify:CR=1 FL=1
MPILNTQKTKNYTYAIWHIDESLDELLSGELDWRRPSDAKNEG